MTVKNGAFKPTAEQEAIYDAASTLKKGEALKVIAFAGAGKTTTLKGLASAKGKERGIYLAFNRDNAEDARKKLALTRCTASSFHGLAAGVMRIYFDKIIDNYKGKDIRGSGILKQFDWNKRDWNETKMAQAVSRTLGTYCQSADAEFDAHHATTALKQMLGDPAFIKDAAKRDFAEMVINDHSRMIADMAQNFFIHEIQNRRMSFDTFLKYVELDPDRLSEAFSMYNYVMADEAQDLNPVQISILRKSGLPLIAVGDPFQQIYSWRGAENALAQLDGQELYLTQSFRFNEEVAEVARHILASMPNGGPTQRLIGAGSGKAPADHKGMKVAIVCRTNAGAIDEAIKLMSRGMKVHVDNLGTLVRDVHSALAIKEGRLMDIRSDELLPYTSWTELEAEAEEGNSPSIERLVKIVNDGKVEQVDKLAAYQKDPSQADFAVCTAHKSKGMEWPGVMLGADWKDLQKLAKRYRASGKKSEAHRTQAEEEYRTLYVAATRPIENLRGHDRICFPKIEEPLDEPERRNTPERSFDAMPG